MRAALPGLGLLSLLVGCGHEDMSRRAIQVVIVGDAEEIQGATTELLLVMEHDEPYDKKSSSTNEAISIRDYDEDGERELVLSVDPSEAGEDALPTVELRPGGFINDRLTVDKGMAAADAVRAQVLAAHTQPLESSQHTRHRDVDHRHAHFFADLLCRPVAGDETFPIRGLWRHVHAEHTSTWDAVITYDADGRRIGHQIRFFYTELLVEQFAGADRVIAANNAVIDEHHGLACQLRPQPG